MSEVLDDGSQKLVKSVFVTDGATNLFTGTSGKKYSIRIVKQGFNSATTAFELPTDRDNYTVNVFMQFTEKEPPPQQGTNTQQEPITVYFDHRSPEKSARSDYESEYNYFSIKQKDYMINCEKHNASTKYQ
ncbi:MAG: hypothetical protein IPN33_20845 [Saprospiraceae bacterium]|nr:hypothetical protein [Saprospiraceae bacterium]